MIREHLTSRKLHQRRNQGWHLWHDDFVVQARTQAIIFLMVYADDQSATRADFLHIGQCSV